MPTTMIGAIIVMTGVIVVIAAPTVIIGASLAAAASGSPAEAVLVVVAIYDAGCVASGDTVRGRRALRRHVPGDDQRRLLLRAALPRQQTVGRRSIGAATDCSRLPRGCCSDAWRCSLELGGVEDGLEDTEVGRNLTLQ